MMCANPYILKGMAFGCGQCLPCRINKRREWAHRIELEAMQHGDNCFATLTYNDENLPKDGSLNPDHLTNWLKRFRKALAERKIRYFAVGEYGDNSWRPHYHAALFGYPACRFGQSRYSERRTRCCASCDLVAQTWGLGHIFLGTLEAHSAAYIAGYVTKKMTSPDDPRLRSGLRPEFARMSLRPGIGYSAMHELADIHLHYNNSSADVPTSLRHGSRVRPLGRYLVRSLRKMVGRDPAAPEVVLEAHREKMRPLLEATQAATPHPTLAKFRPLVLKNQVIDASEGKRARQEARQKIWKPKRHL